MDPRDKKKPPGIEPGRLGKDSCGAATPENLPCADLTTLMPASLFGVCHQLVSSSKLPNTRRKSAQARAGALPLERRVVVQPLTTERRQDASSLTVRSGDRRLGCWSRARRAPGEQDTLPKWSNGVDSRSTSASCVGSNPTAFEANLAPAAITHR